MHTTTPRRSRSGSSDGQRRSFSHSNSRRSTSPSGQRSRFSTGPRTGGAPRSDGSRSGGGARSSGFRSGGGSRSGGFRSGGGGRSGGNRGGRKIATFDPSQFINKNPVDVAPEVYEPKHKFSDFGLDGRLVRTIASMGITTPSPIQDQIIPDILNGRDVIGLAETGTGKTAAFLVPLIEKTTKDYNQQTLILTPTRELALQVEAELHKLAKSYRLYSTVCVGGTSIHPQLRALRRRQHFVIGTPGRILDLIERGSIQTENFTNVVLDEADRMLDMGFIHDMRSILSNVPDDAQTLFFSATMNVEAKRMVNDFLNNPVEVSVKKKDVTNSIEQDVVRHGHHDKFSTLTNLLADASFKRVIIFGAMKHSVEKLAQELSTHGIVAESIHGNKNHSQRQRSLARFKSGNARVLVATDVAARGIHVDNVTHVINYDLPQSFEDYVHRIGRTGRANEKGMALTFIADHA